MTDFTAHAHPVLAVHRPTCRSEAGSCCRRPNGHRAAHLHAARSVEADQIFIEQHGPSAAIIHAASGWLIDPRGRIRD